MKKFAKSVLGVTLLEIMLVLAIAAMIIVMSVRYYQSATANQQANGALQMIQGVTAAADSLAQASGSYSAATSIAITSLMPNGSLTLPWGTTMTITPVSSTSYTVTLPSTPQAVCVLLVSRLGASKKYTSLAPATGVACAVAGPLQYTYDTTQ